MLAIDRVQLLGHVHLLEQVETWSGDTCDDLLGRFVVMLYVWVSDLRLVTVADHRHGERRALHLGK